MEPLRIAVLISGRGSNLQALIDACAEPQFPARIGLVISNRSDATGLARAEKVGLATHIIDHRAFQDRISFELAVDRVITEAQCGLVCLAGFMRLLTAWFVERWRDKLINVHPSLLPAYKGLDTHTRVVADGGRISGCTIHFVRAEMDDGPIIVQAAVAVRPDDDADRLAARVLAAEHACYPLAVRLIAQGRVRVVGGRVEINGALAPSEMLIVPAAGA